MASLQKHVDVVGVLHLVAGVLSLLVALTMLLLALGALSIFLGAEAETANVAAGVTAAAFLVGGVLMAVWAAANAGVGRALRRGRPWGRTAALALAVLNLFIVPFGTALSIYTLWALLHEETRRLFEQGRPARA
jgi:hypothetical protein